MQKFENLESCPRLDTINCSNNYIHTIENIGSDVLPELNSLYLTHNKLRTAEDVANLVQCKSLSVLDLAHNHIEDIAIINVLAQMPALRVLVLTGNPVINQISSYRKTLINECVLILTHFLNFV